MTLSITAAKSKVAGSPQILVSVSATTGAPNAVPANSSLRLTRIHSDGSRWAVLTEDDPRVLGGSWVWLDVHAPFNQAVRYQVTTAGSTATSTATFAVSNKAWLLSPVSAALGFEIHGIKEIGERSQDTRSGRFDPIGGSAIYLSDGRREDIKGSLQLRVPVAREKALMALVKADTMVLINTPGTLGWDIGWMWVQPTSITYSNPSALVSYGYRQADIDFEQGAQPFADLVPLWTSGSAAAYFLANGKTSGDVPALYANSAAFVTNTRL